MGSSNLPRNWTVVPVREIFDILGGGTPSTAVPEYWQGDIPWITSADIDERHKITPRRFISDRAIAKSATNLVPAGSVVVVTRVGLGKVGIAETPLCFSQDSQALILASELMNPKYVLFYMGTAVGVFKHISRGTTISGVTKRQLANLEFRLPPLREQGRIAAEIEKQFTRLGAAVAALRRVQANLKRYRAAVLKAAVEGRLVPTEAELARTEGRSFEPASELLQRILFERRARWEAHQLAKFRASCKEPTDQGWKSKYKEPVTPNESGLLALPAGWTWATLSQLSEIQGGIQKQPSRRPAQNPHPFLRVANVLRGRLDLSEVHDIELFKGEIEKLRLETGDLLVVEGNGSPSEIGRMAIWKGEIENCVHQNHIIRARLLGAIPPAYVAAYWNSPEGASRVLDVASSTSGLYTLSVSKVGRLPVPLPPLAEQHRIVAELERRLSVTDELELLVEANLRRAERLRQAILKRAFEGKLVPQNPDDEPASVLLGRIRAERTRRAQARVPVPGSTATPGCAEKSTKKSTGKSAGATATPGCAGKLEKADTGKSAGATATPGCAGKKIKKKARARVPVPQQQKQ